MVGTNTSDFSGFKIIKNLQWVKDSQGFHLCVSPGNVFFQIFHPDLIFDFRLSGLRGPGSDSGVLGIFSFWVLVSIAPSTRPPNSLRVSVRGVWSATTPSPVPRRMRWRRRTRRTLSREDARACLKVQPSSSFFSLFFFF